MSLNNDFETEDGFEGIQEAPIPGSEPNPKRQVVAQKPRESAMPDPNNVVKKPDINPSRNYNGGQAQVKQGRTETVTQGYAPQGQTVVDRQQGQPQPRPQQGNSQPRPQQGMIQGQPQQGQSPKKQRKDRPQKGQPQQGQVPQQGNMQGAVQGRVPKKSGKGKIIGVIAGVALVAIIGVVAVPKIMDANKLVAVEENYESSGKFALDSLQNALNNYDATTVDGVVGTEDGDSFIAQEWAYVNGVKLREEFIQKVCKLVTFEYPSVQQMSTTGVGMTNDDGSALMIESMMNNGEAIKVTIPDYDALSQSMDEETDLILKMFKSAKYSEADYTWHDEMANLMLQYICDKTSLPTKQVEITLPLAISTSGRPYVKDDAELDDLLFGSDEFHDMCAKFSQICVGWTGYQDETYTEMEEQDNPEYAEWYVLFQQYYTADEGKFNKRTSKWEPWYLRDENNNYIYNEDGTKKVNYYSIKDENGNDWIQPAEKIMVEVEKVRQIEDPWVEETAIMYNWIGQNYIQNKYTGKGSTVVRVGDGSRENPAGIGTTIITKMKGTDGKYHDVRVALLGYWTGQDAIDYAEKFSTKNRGFTTSSVVQLITYEVSIENLENQDVEFIASEMTLTDKNSNISSRTGTMYGFSETVTVKAGETIIINDWATSTELPQKYVCWGKDFGRNYSMVYFDALAGTGEIPPYSAYKAFTGQSGVDEDDIETGSTVGVVEDEAIAVADDTEASE